MTRGEPNPNSTFTVYRLLKVSLSRLLDMKKEADGRGLESPRMRETLKRLKALRKSQRCQKFQVGPREQANARGPAHAREPVTVKEPANATASTYA